ncbi:alpha/beta hydrolase family protein [Glaciecola petra]|uniref:Dienelactone hydrolase n=1 Tax=Glaciecola petra TaxID=3075602 RepID=A0ABU2ZRY2_9ALTE|nr:dienelactone hydrolase [Aestuariibacter sp. P117]MDT0595161.1 dienelactone hydrolase [Aestuariibacter sp. P117]
MNTYFCIRALIISIQSSLLLISSFVHANNHIDFIRPDAPELAAYGEHKIGVKTLHFINPNQIDVLNIDTNNNTLPTYDRPLTIELWYPAAETAKGDTILKVYMRDGKKVINLHGKAIRDAESLSTEVAFPLVIISHGYPGNRFLMAHLAENIASKGFVVASIDHTDSTYRHVLPQNQMSDKGNPRAHFASTLLNRSLDQEATLNFLANESSNANSFLHNKIDTNNVAVVGYSMGGYGALITAGASVNPALVSSPIAPPQKLLSIFTESSPKQAQRPDTRIKTIITFAPWGKNHQVWEDSSLAKVSLPSLIIGGSLDDVSGYENGIRAIWEQMTSSTRALLTFENANHSAGAPMPAPEESYVYDNDLGIYISDHYTDPVWDSARMNNISQHFVSAWLAVYLKGDEGAKAYLALTPESKDGVWSKNSNGETTPNHTYWQGFKNRTAAGLRFETLVPK